MTDLITIVPNEEGLPTVSARELHTFLDASERFTNWFERQLQYGFVESVDYSGCKVFNTLANQLLDDYALTIDCAKEIAMIQRSEKGKIARQYFIELEKKYKAQQSLVPFNPASVSRREMALMILDAEDKIQALSQEVVQLEKVVVSQSKKVAYVDEVLTASNCWTTTSIAKDLGMSAIGLNRLLKNLGVQFKRDEHWVLTAYYQNKGYTKTQTHTYTGNDGDIRTSLSTEWTELGRAFIIKKVADYRAKQVSIQLPPAGQSATA